MAKYLINQYITRCIILSLHVWHDTSRDDLNTNSADLEQTLT